MEGGLLQMQIIRKMNQRRQCWIKAKNTWFLRILIIYFALQVSHIGGLLQDQYIGCFKLTPPDTEHNSKDYQLTIQKCIEKCVIQSATYAALQNGTLCHCVDDYGGQLPDEICNVMCAGNQFEYCGGASIDNGKSSMYSVSVVYAVCPVGLYGQACDRFCHCKRQIPCDRLSGHCPDGCDGQYTGPACSTISLREKYIGCFKDKVGSRVLTHKPYGWTFRNTLEMCTNACTDASYSYSGAQFGIECFCGESYDRYNSLSATKCSSKCSGNKNQFCGGLNANSVYSVCPAGRYERGCRGKCHCLNNGRCVYRSGSCLSSQCKPGWTGASCNIRDCTSYNGDCGRNEICSTIDLKFSTLSACRCSEGFYKRKIWEDCIDKDECSEDQSMCGKNALNCVNTIGGYQCLCPNGQTMLNTACLTDRDQCSEMPSVCGQNALNCTNTIGGYQCLCPNGQTTFNRGCMSDLRVQPVDKNGCSKIPSVCGQNALSCTNAIGGYQCLCSNGQTTFNMACVIVCGQNALNCTNGIGGYECLCPNGQTMLNTACKTDLRVQPVDKDECSEIPSVCGQNALSCTNAIGGYQCLCSNGQTTFNMACVIEKDECSDITSVCGQNALNCTNGIGGYECLCPNGQTMLNTACMTGFEAMEPSNTWLIVGTAGGALLCVTVILGVAVGVHICRRKQRNIESTTSGNVINSDTPAVQETAYCTATTEGTSYYATLNVGAYNTDIYEQIEEDNV